MKRHLLSALLLVGLLATGCTSPNISNNTQNSGDLQDNSSKNPSNHEDLATSDTSNNSSEDSQNIEQNSSSNSSSEETSKPNSSTSTESPQKPDQGGEPETGEPEGPTDPNQGGGIPDTGEGGDSGSSGPDENKDPELSLEEILKIDPFYPEIYDNGHYKLVVNDIANRIALNEDKTRATLFAPNVGFGGGYYDVNKTSPSVDGRLCWAASISNMLAWYLANYQGNTTNIEKDPNKIMDIFRNHFDPLEGFDPLQGLAWYFTGHMLSGDNPHDLPKGILNELDHVGDVWSIIDPSNYGLFGNYQEQYPFVKDDLYFNDSIDNFCKTLLGHLHYGPSSLMVVAKGAGATSGHAITLWGAEYDVRTGKIYKIYITDSDDGNMYPGSYLREIKLQTSRDPDYALEMTNYYVDNSIPSRYITAATVLYDSNSIKKSDHIA